jgi:hypothetical protein
MLTDKNLLLDDLVFTGELRLSDDQILQAWIAGTGPCASMRLREIDSSGAVIKEWPEIGAKHLPLLKVIVGNTISLMREREAAQIVASHSSDAAERLMSIELTSNAPDPGSIASTAAPMTAQLVVHNPSNTPGKASVLVVNEGAAKFIVGRN